MARLARVVLSKVPHHITQRGNRRQQTFFNDEDYKEYLSLLMEYSKKYRVEILSYCLMPNHVHLIAVPSGFDGLRKAISETHCRYTRMINFREKWRGHLWQGRFSSFPMDEGYLLSAARYIEMNPVRANLVSLPQEWNWSSAKAHIENRDNELVKVKPLLKMVDNWESFLHNGFDDSEIIRKHEKTGRPLGDDQFISKCEQKTGIKLHKEKPGRKKKWLNNIKDFQIK